MSQSDAMLATSKGLLLINLTGGVKESLLSGYFTDVITDGKEVFVVDAKRNMVHVLSRSEQQNWTIQLSFEADLHDDEVIATLSVTQGSCILYVSM